MTREDLARKIIEVIDAYGDKKLDMIATIEAICKQAIDEPISKDFEKEIEMIRKYYFINDDFDKAELDGRTISNIARHFANWQRQQDNNDANHALVEQTKTQQMCYEKGMADMKQQLMANAVEGAYIRRNRYTKKNVLNGFDMTCDAIQGFKDKDKVKIIILKE